MNVDVEDELVNDGMRVVRTMTTMGMRMYELVNRHASEVARRQADAHREAARVLEQQQRAQQHAMEMLVRPALSEQWCQRAGDRDLATAFVYAEAWKDRDPVAEVAYGNLAEEIGKRGVELEEFANGNVPEHALEEMPEPSFDVTDEEQAQVAEKMSEIREHATEAGRELPEVARTDPKFFAMTQVISEEQKRQMANLAETSGRDFAVQTFEGYLSQDQRAKMRAWEEIAKAEAEKAEAEQLRGNAETEHATEAGVTSEGEKAEKEADAAATKLDGRGEARESFAEQELAGKGQFRDYPGEISDAKLASVDPDAANARQVSRAGRAEALTTALKNSRRRSSGKARTRAQISEREQERDR